MFLFLTITFSSERSLKASSYLNSEELARENKDKNKKNEKNRKETKKKNKNRKKNKNILWMLSYMSLVI